jgi:HlyD family secretion protein
MTGAVSRSDEARRGRVAIRDTAGQDRVLDTARAGRRRLFAVGATAIVVIGVGAALLPTAQRFFAADRSVPLERLRLAVVSRGDFIRDVAVRGRVVAAVKPTVYAPADGVVTLAVNAGDTVEQGAVIASVHSPKLSNLLDQERATLQRMQTELTRQDIERKKREAQNQQTTDMARVAIRAAERELRRAEASWAEQIISRQDYEKASDEVARAQLEFAHAQQNARLESESLEFELKTREFERDRQALLVEDLERRVAGLQVVSPVSGMIGSLAVEQTAQVAENQPLLTVVDLTALEIEVQVPQEYGDDLGLGMPAQLSFGGSQYDGEITAISPEVNENQVSARVRFAGDPPTGLRQNQRVSARILLESRENVLKVQRGQFVDSGAGRIAYVVDGNLAHRRDIEVGAASIGEVEVLSGLAEGQTVIISDLGQFEGAETVLLND